MEADWEVELGGDAPVIDAHWKGFVDLRAHPERVSELSECCDFPELSDALLRLNGPDSPVWTFKTDVFTLDQVDPDEMDASTDESLSAIACYIDMLQRDKANWRTLFEAERDSKALCAELRTIRLRCCRTDIVVRRAMVYGCDVLGATVYSTACGPTLAEAKNKLGKCLAALTGAIDHLVRKSGARGPAA